MQQRRALYSLNTTYICSLIDSSYGYGSKRGRIGLIVSKSEKIRLIRAYFDAVDADMRFDLCYKVEHPKLY